MTDLDMISMLDKIIMKKKPQNIRIRYYPYSEKQYIDDINILCIKTMSKIEIEKIKAILKDYQHITGRYTEFGIKDTFVRINYDESNNETSRIYFRKQIFILPQDEILQKEFPGIFIIEIFNLCEKEELPHIIDYHYDANYDANTYTISFPMDDKKKNINYKICIINSQYLDFNKDLNINMDINAQINKFTKDIKQHIGKINNIIC
jgi:hypothetical protein